MDVNINELKRSKLYSEELGINLKRKNSQEILFKFPEQFKKGGKSRHRRYKPLPY